VKNALILTVLDVIHKIKDLAQDVRMVIILKEINVYLTAVPDFTH